MKHREIDNETTQSARGETTSKQTVTDEVRPSPKTHHPVSKAQILATAKSVAHELAIKDMSETKPTESAIALAIKRSLKGQREAPGVSTLADGTIRVVTQFGTSYCVKPKDDTGILGPEDDMSVSMTCP
jgi:hypothetical protein